MQTKALQGEINNSIYQCLVTKSNELQTNEEQELLGDIDILAATFNYDLEGDSNGIFKIW